MEFEMAFQRVSKTTQGGQNCKLHFIYVHIIDKMFMKWLPLNFVYQCLHQLSPFYVFGLFLTLLSRSAQISIKQRKFLTLSILSIHLSHPYYYNNNHNHNNNNNNNNNSNNNNNNNNFFNNNFIYKRHHNFVNMNTLHKSNQYQ